MPSPVEAKLISRLRYIQSVWREFCEKKDLKSFFFPTHLHSQHFSPFIPMMLKKYPNKISQKKCLTSSQLDFWLAI